MLIIVTGKSGSGKTVVSSHLCELNTNIVMLDIDKVGHKVNERDDVKNRIVNELGAPLIDGKIDRKELGRIVFSSAEKMDILTDITWGAMEEEIEKFISNNKEKVIVLDWALIPKTKYYDESDIKILVKSDVESRKSRAIKRDSINEDKFNEREGASLNYTDKDYDYVIVNDDIEETKRKVEEIYESIISR